MGRGQDQRRGPKEGISFPHSRTLSLLTVDLKCYLYVYLYVLTLSRLHVSATPLRPMRPRTLYYTRSKSLASGSFSAPPVRLTAYPVSVPV